MTNITTLVTYTQTAQAAIATVFWPILYICAGIAVGSIAWRFFKRATEDY